MRTSPLQWRVRAAAIDLHRGVWSTKYYYTKFKVQAAVAGMRTTAREMILFRFSEYVSFNTVTASINSCILATLFHDCDIKYTC